MSMLGFFCAQAQNLRIPAERIVEGIKDWSVKAGGLSEPPYFSAEFLRRVGVVQGRGDRRRGSSSSSRSERGSFGMRSGHGDRPSWADRDRSPRGDREGGFRRRDRDSETGYSRRDRDSEIGYSRRDREDDGFRRRDSGEGFRRRDRDTDDGHYSRRQGRDSDEGFARRQGGNTEAWRKVFNIEGH
jgi:ATP-dependent RNA helicase MSS116, mitochondrial